MPRPLLAESQGAVAAERSVTVHSSWRGIVLTCVGAIVLAVIAIALLLGNGVGVVSVAVTVLAVGAALVALFDLPIAAEFSADGVTRRALLRRHHLPWREITRLKRHRVGVVRTQRREVSGGLVADRSGRNYTLLDAMESPREYDEIRAVLGSELAERLGLTDDRRPPEGTPPTWLYRRKRWHPEDVR